ncbi:hypothetical protein [Streptacidiphilus sp. EB103A]|uniref:hypothetical protein n=1 Tax=Streptacidiphilus sp. EB103A TaxID=3156275 RepID=UPI003515222B
MNDLIFPKAQDVLLPSSPYEDHGRQRKAMAMAFDLWWNLAREGEALTPELIAGLTREDFTKSAKRIHERSPRSEKTDRAIRAYLTTIMNECADSAPTPTSRPTTASNLRREADAPPTVQSTAAPAPATGFDGGRLLRAIGAFARALDQP